MRRTYKRRAAPLSRRRRAPRKGQRGRGFLSSLKKIASNPTVRALGKTAFKKAIQYAPKPYGLETSKIKNKRIRGALQSESPTNLLNNSVNKYGA